MLLFVLTNSNWTVILWDHLLYHQGFQFLPIELWTRTIKQVVTFNFKIFLSHININVHVLWKTLLAEVSNLLIFRESHWHPNCLAYHSLHGRHSHTSWTKLGKELFHIIFGPPESGTRMKSTRKGYNSVTLAILFAWSECGKALACSPILFGLQWNACYTGYMYSC